VAELKITSLLRPHRKALTVALFAAIGESITDLLQPWPLKIVFDNVLSTRPLRGHGWANYRIVSAFGADHMAILRFAVLAALLIAIADSVCTYGEKSSITTVGQWVMHDLRRTLYSHVQRLSLSYHDRKQTGDLISRVTSDIDAIQSFITSGLLGMLVDCLTLSGMMAVMFWINWRFTLIALSPAPLLFLVVYTYTRRIKQASRAVRKKEGEIVSVIQEVLNSIRVVKAFSREDYEQRRLEAESLESVEIALRARGLKAKLSPIVEVLVAIGTGLVLWFGASMVLHQRLDNGSLIVFIWYLGKMYKPMQDLSKMTDAYSRAAVGYERIREILETTREIHDTRAARPAPRFRGLIEFDDVSFGYTPDDTVLHHINMRIEPGQTAALVGPTGTGKTTLISLLPRFYDVTSGAVKIDGADVRRFTQRSLRSQISFVLQETLLFHGPVWYNIGYGKPDSTPDEIRRAAELANAHEFIEKMPEGYDTVISERGATLSGGQRQRIAIARAIIRQSPILILDEPTTGLDAESEALVVDALNRLMRDRTCIVIAHRLATIRRADVIFVMDKGTIAQRGTHDELLHAGGLYADFYELQFHHQEEARGV